LHARRGKSVDAHLILLSWTDNIGTGIHVHVKEPTIGGAEKHRWFSVIYTGGLEGLELVW